MNSINENSIITSLGSWQYIIDINNIGQNNKMYIIPQLRIRNFENFLSYNYGDVIDYSYNGVDRWTVVGKQVLTSEIFLVPETPIELLIDNADDIIDSKVEKTIRSFSDGVNVYSVNKIGNGDGDPFSIQSIQNFLNQQTEKVFFLGNSCWERQNNKILYNGCGESYYYENGELNTLNYQDVIYTESTSRKLGYRPIVTLKICNFEEDVNENDKKEMSSKLQVGDYVKYEAKGYKNWKVLSVDNGLGTVDIISGGIVKNLTLSGKDDWDNYEDIIQREVDEYKNGDQAKKATTVTSKDLKTLKEIDKSVLSRYWILSKNTFVKNDYSFGNETAKFVYYCVGAVKNSNNNSTDESVLRNIAIYADLKGDKGAVDYYNNDSNFNYYRDEINSSSYTAGLRPVITLKLDSVEKLPKEETKKIEESTEKQEKVFIKEQESKNKNYKGPSKVDDSTSSTGNNEVKTNDNGNTKDNITDNNTSNVEKIVYKDKPFYKYGFIIATILCIIEPVITILIYKKIKER